MRGGWSRERWSLAGLLGLVIAACGGTVSQTALLTDAGPEAGSGGKEQLDATVTDWDGWSAAAVGEASAPAPACNLPALECGTPFPGTTPFSSSQEAANALVGRWSFCGDASDFYPTYQVGEEYAADGTYYQLVAGTGGQLLRNLDPASIGNWEIDLGPRDVIAVHTFQGGVQRSGGLSACPPSLVLLGVEARVP